MTTKRIWTVKDMAKALGKDGKIIRRKLRAKGHGVGFGTKYEWSSETDYKRILLSLRPKAEVEAAAKKAEAAAKKETTKKEEEAKKEEAKKEEAKKLVAA